MKERYYMKVISILVLSGFFLAFLITCEKPERVASIKTVDITDTDISYNSAILKGDLIDLGSEPIEDYGIIVSENASFLNPVPKSGSGTAKKGVFQIEFTGLIKNTTYYYKAYVTVNSDPIYGGSKNFTTKDTQPPSATTGSATSVTTDSATLNGTVNANDLSTTVTFEYGLTDSYGSEVTADQSPVTGTTATAVSADLSSLTASTTYHYRVKAVSIGGTTYGDDTTFTTTSATDAPSATTESATSVTSSSATLNGTVNANDLSTAVTFEYGLTSSYGTEVTAAESPVTGTTTTAVTYDLTGLTASTTYHYRVKAVSTGGTTYGDDMEFTTASTLPTVSDYDGNEYNIITIGTQEWLQQNLKSTKYNDGTLVPLVTDGTEWSNLTTPGFCYYNNDAATYKETYGALYNWHAVNTGKLCPTGWHVPTDAEWTTMEDYLISTGYNYDGSTTGNKISKALAATTNWNVSTNTGVVGNTDYPAKRNETGFTALPGGNRDNNGACYALGENGYWWSSTGYSTTNAWNRNVSYNSSYVSTYNDDKRYGFSVRCLKGPIPSGQTNAATAVESTSVTLNGNVYANGASTTVTFEYGTSTSYGDEITATQSPVSGTTPVDVSAGLSGLTAGTEYHYRVKAVNSGGTSYGGDMTFTTTSLTAPEATTGSATDIASASATLNGTVNANGSSTTVTFEYGLTTTYGTEVTAAESPVTGTTATAVTYDLSGLTASTTYHYRVKAVNTGGTAYGDDMTFTTTSALTTVSDYDGNTYNIITIGTQEWIQENLKTTHYNNGNAIANFTGNTEWSGLTSGAYCWYDNDEGTYKDTYGALYNWYTTVDVRNVCPAGWHVPTDAEWTTLSDYLGGSSIAGGLLKETGTTHWISPNTDATNETDFTALPGGYRNDAGSFYSVNYYGYWWSSTEYNTTLSWYRGIYYNSSETDRNGWDKPYGLSIRCVKGELPLTQAEDATAITATSATLNGQVNPNDASTTVTFEYGLTDSYGSEVTAAESPVTGTTPASVSSGISSLSESTTYHYRVKAVNSYGTTYSTDMTFTTLTPPTATTGSATSITGTTATVDGTVNANGLSTTVTFEYGETTAYGSEITANESPVTGSTNTAVTGDLSSLTASTTYHYRVKAVSAAGTTYGDDMTFETLSLPAATTGSATRISSIFATLNGTVNANNLSTTVTFEYGLTTGYGTEATADESPVTGTTSTAVSYDLTGLTASTTYHYRVKAVSSGGTTYGDDMTFTNTEQVADADGNNYNTVQIGTQLWIMENLKTIHYTTGDAIANVTGNTEWGALTSGAYCWYDNDEGTYKDTYGALYNWYTTVDVRNVCPAGWHVPTDAEWTILTDDLGGETIAGGKLKETGTDHWSSPNTGATNESGLTTLPGGRRAGTGAFNSIMSDCYFWSSTEYDVSNAFLVDMFYNYINLYRNAMYKEYGFSIRCIEGELPLVQTDTAIAVASESATLKGIVNSNGASTTVSFEYGITTDYGSNVTADQSPASGSDPVEVSAGLTSLTPGTTYHYRIKAENSGGTNYGSDMEFTTPAQVSDVDGNTYNTVIIGTQTWMQENLKTTKYKNSNSIPLVTDGGTWSGLTTPAYCWYDNDEATYGDTYGTLYNWYTVNTGNLCPAGWHVPSDDEWTTMEYYLIANGYNYDGTTTDDKIAKALASTTLWTSSTNTGAVGNADYPAKRNATGFTALPGGYRYADGAFSSIGNYGFWWSSTEYSTSSAWDRGLDYDYCGVGRFGYDKQDGFSVRCVRD